MNINIHAAKTNFSRLIEKVGQGETIIISKAGKPVAKLVPYDAKPEKRKPGFIKGKIWIADDFDAPLPEEILADLKAAMKLIIDTQILVWWTTADKRLPKKAADIIANGANEVLVSAASVWEIAIKVSVGKLQMPLENNFQELLITNGLTPIAVKLSHAIAWSTLPFHHRDPFDRMLVAQSLIEDCQLLTADKQLEAYGKTILLA